MASLLSARMTGRYRPHLSLREGLEQPPRSGAEKPRFSNPFYSRAPFPIALDDPGSVLAVKGSLRRFAPWTAPGRSERRPLFTREKGGGSGRGARGRVASARRRTYACIFSWFGKNRFQLSSGAGSTGQRNTRAKSFNRNVLAMRAARGLPTSGSC